MNTNKQINYFLVLLYKHNKAINTNYTYIIYQLHHLNLSEKISESSGFFLFGLGLLLLLLGLGFLLFLLGGGR